MALEESENKFYSIGFADAQNSCEPVMLQTQRYGIKERWLAAVAALGVLVESPFINPEQIPYLEPPLVQNPADADDEDTQSIRELV